MRIASIGYLLAACIAIPHAQCRASWDFSDPVNIGAAVNSASQDSTPSISDDGLTLYFFSDRPGGEGGWDLWSTSRATLGASWSSPVNLGSPLNTDQSEASPSISADGLSLYFERGTSSRDIWVATRPSTSDLWSIPTALTAINSASLDTDPDISRDGLSLYFGSDRPGGSGRDVYVSIRPTTSDPWGTPVRLGPEVNGPNIDDGASISPDGLSLFFMSDREDPGGSFDIFVSERATTASSWGVATKVNVSLPPTITDSVPEMSFDGRTIYFASNRPGGEGSVDIWAASYVPEPSASALLIAGGLGIGAIKRRTAAR